jgi:GLPGLI family protein
MKRKIIACIVLFVAFSPVLKGQKVLDKAYLKCSYLFIQERDTLTHQKDDDLLLLQIGHQISKCYSYYTYQSDSLKATKDGAIAWRKLFMDAISKAGSGIPKNFPYKRLRCVVYKNLPAGKMTVTDGVSMQDFVYEDTLNACQWQIEDSSKVVLGYQCQKAVCNFRGRHWTAWFASDVPVSDGPWKLGGLPGLIMEAYDRGNQLYFLITGMQKVNDEPIIQDKSSGRNPKFEKTTRIQLLKATKNYLMNINGYLEAETGINLGMSGGKVMRYDLMERDYK